MAVYGVVMGQGISMQDLGGNKLMTGFHPDYLSSCSAIILANPAAGSAGLYHFPSGEIRDDLPSQQLISAMARETNPTEVFVAFGIVGENHDPTSDKPSTKPAYPKQTKHLLSFLEGLLRIAPQSGAAIHGSAAIDIAGGVSIISDARPLKFVNLAKYLPGSYQGGIKIYKRGK